MTQIRSVKYKINTPNNFRVCDQRKALSDMLQNLSKLLENEIPNTYLPSFLFNFLDVL